MHFGIQHYPTPEKLARKMLAGIKWDEISTILEPEAGSGALALIARDLKKATMSYHHRDNVDIDTIEIDPSLQSVLKGHGLRVVHDNFLTYQPHKRYSLIVMNPPFSEGDAHLLKAIDLQRLGSHIRCLLNAETLRNLHTNVRKDLARKLKDIGATIEFIEGAFLDGERASGVEVAIVSIDIPYADDESIILDKLRKAQATEEASAAPDKMIHSEMILGMVDQYNFEAKAGLSLINEHRKLSPYVLDRVGEYAKPILWIGLGERGSQYSSGVDSNDYISALRNKYWSALFANPEFTAILTSELQDKYLREIKTLTDYEFSLFNIYAVRAQFGGIALAGVEKAIIDLFDELSRKNHFSDETSENVHYFNGWRTNKCWCINKKVIRPMYGLEKDYRGRPCLSYNSRAIQQLSDIEKVFKYLDGQPMNATNTLEIIVAKIANGQTRNICTHYFNVTFFLKGTCHITFNNLDLLHKFNIYGAQQKAWLPPAYGRKKYSDMDPEEQAVVDNFEGAESYANTYLRQDYYLTDASKLLAAAA